MPSTPSITGLLARVTRSYRAKLNTVLQASGFDLSSEMCGILVELWENDVRNPLELAQTLKKDKAGITRLLRSLHQRDYIEITKDPTDLRRKNICLSPAGKALQTQLEPVLIQVREATLNGITKTDKATTQAVLYQLIANLEA